MVLRRVIAASLALAAVVFISGCGHESVREGFGHELTAGDAAQQYALVDGTNRLITEAYVQVVSVSAEAAAASNDRAIQEDSLRWRINSVNRLDALHSIPDPRVRFVAVWTGIMKSRDQLTLPDGKPRFGKVQDKYVKVMDQLDAQALAVARASFPPDLAETIRPEIVKLAKSVAIPTSTSGFAASASRTFSRILAVPMAPVSGLQGVGDTPSAINHFSETAADIGRMVENLPERARWQSELLLLEAQESGAVATMLQNMDKVIAEAELVRTQFSELSVAVQKVPGQANAMLQEVLKKQPELSQDLARVENSMKLAKETVQQADQTVASVNTALVSAQTAVESVRKTLVDVDKSAGAIKTATVEIRGLMADIRAMSPKPATQEAAKTGEEDTYAPAKVAQAAKDVESATAEIRKLLADIKSPSQLTGVEQTAQRIDGLVSKAAWKIAGLIVLFFASAFAYRLATRKLASQKS